MENWDKKARSEAQRLQSIQDRIDLERKKKDAIRLSLHDVDSHEKSNKRITFNDSDSDDNNTEILPSTSNEAEEEVTKDKSSKASSNRMQLFDDDDEQVMDDIVFENKHKGKKGEKLMKMEAQFVTDDRFKMGTNFLSESEESENEMEVEKRKNRDLLSKVLGKVVLPQQKTVNVVDTRDSVPHRPFTRFDPTNAEHVAWVKKYGSKIAEKKTKKLPTAKEENENEEKDNRNPNIDRTTEEKFFEVDSQFSEELKAKLQKEQGTDSKEESFSFLASVGRPASEKEQAEPLKEIADVTLSLPTPKTKTLTLTKGGVNFFISSKDSQVISVISNFRRTQSEAKTLGGWTNYRNSIMKIYHHQRKLALKAKHRNPKTPMANRKRKAEDKKTEEMSFDSMFKDVVQLRKPTYYDLLGCDESSSAEQITAEYRSKVRSLHPDKARNVEGHDDFTRFQAAYSVLNDTKRRKLYDSWLSCPIQMNFESFEQNSDSIRQSMHWVTPKTVPMIPANEDNSETVSRWTDRYKSEVTERFRSYQI
ncbi:unnamed protein product [Auanema sp. JU1783]|nr:unnamed protein product [Auanema sp. JU1783]